MTGVSYPHVYLSINIDADEIDPLSFFAMQEKESKKIKPQLPSQDFDLLNTLVPKPDNNDDCGLEELFPEMESKPKDDEFLLNLLSTDDASNTKYEKEDSKFPEDEVDHSDIPFQESK